MLYRRQNAPQLNLKNKSVAFSFRNLATHSVVLDVLAEDSEHRIYNIEIQNADKDNHQKRVRYYQSNIDISYLDKKENYENLPEVYLIYMTRFDLFKGGRASYVINRCIAETNQVVDNGVHEIYVNAAVQDETTTTELMRFFLGTDVEHQQFPKISKRIQYFKEEKEGVEYMCEAVERYGDQREARGMLQGMQKIPSKLSKKR